VAIGAAAVAYLTTTSNKQGDSKPAGTGTGSTTGSSGGVALYETRKAVNEYLQFHFGVDDDILPYEFGPKGALNFTARCALLCERFCVALTDINGELDPPVALDIGCAVGGASFELAKSFQLVVGMDYSQHFVDAANAMKERKSMRYTAQIEGDIEGEFTASIPDDVEVERVKFIKGDACELPTKLGQFDAVLAANLLCRLPDPSLFLKRLPTLVKPQGIVVLVSPYSWLEAWTPKAKWIGATTGAAGPCPSIEALKSAMEKDFELVHQEDMPFLIREHVRKFQWGCSHGTVWRRR